MARLRAVARPSNQARATAQIGKAYAWILNSASAANQRLSAGRMAAATGLGLVSGGSGMSAAGP